MKAQQICTDIEYGKRKRISRREVFLDTYRASCTVGKAGGTNTPLLFPGEALMAA
ncbi:MAG: hypothetical protein LBB61_07040 [Treponema sp.]|jgi:hypothetical protein|nr:hypothetical protein [Treponema sp.]